MNTQNPVKTRPIEIIRCWDDGTWDTEIIEIDARVEPGSLEELPAAEEVTTDAMQGCGQGLVQVGIYNSMEDCCEC